MRIPTIAVVDLWHLGCVTAACLAKQFNVIGMDSDQKRINKLKKSQAPIHEPGLNELIAQGISSRKLKFTSNLKDIEEADYIWITQDIPVDDDDYSDLSELFSLFKRLAMLNSSHNYIVSSQVPVGTCDKLIQVVSSDKKPEIAYIPENLQLGRSLNAFQSPDMIVIGSNNSAYAKRVTDLIIPFYRKPIMCNVTTAELAKHAINCFLATSISFANVLSDIAITTNANAYQVANIMKLDKRISDKLPIFPGPWFSGGTLARDIRSIQAIGKEINKSTQLFDTVLNINKGRVNDFINRLAEHIEISGAQIAIMGLIYTENTDTLRRSPGMQIINKLDQRKAKIRAYEPMISDLQIPIRSVSIFQSALDAAKGADAVIIIRAGCVTDLDIIEISEVMRHRIILDIWGFFRKDDIKELDSIFIFPGYRR